jgi:thiamine biosynthesis lipoprotein
VAVATTNWVAALDTIKIVERSEPAADRNVRAPSPADEAPSKLATCNLQPATCNLFAPFLALALLLTGCRAPSITPPLTRFEFTSPHMGTLFSIKLYASNRLSAETAAHAAFTRIAALDDIMSDYQADSELMRLCEQPVGIPVSVSADLFTVMHKAEKVSELSDGAFDITVGPYVRFWRFARKKKVLPTRAEIATAAKSVGYKKLRLDPHKSTVTLLAPNMRLDLGGIGKGYAADQAMRVLKGRGIDRALVAASGDIAIGDPPPGQRGWKVGISGMTTATNEPPRTLSLHNCGISTSGDTEQSVEIGGVRYSHIVDPSTGLGLTQRIQATIIGPDATTTDGLDTTVSILGIKRGLALVDSLPGVSALIVVRENGQTKLYPSRRFQAL